MGLRSGGDIVGRGMVGGGKLNSNICFALDFYSSVELGATKVTTAGNQKKLPPTASPENGCFQAYSGTRISQLFLSTTRSCFFVCAATVFGAEI